MHILLRGFCTVVPSCTIVYACKVTSWFCALSKFFLGTRLASCPGLSYEKEEGLPYTTCISAVLLFRLAKLSHYTNLPPEFFVLPCPDDSARYVKWVMVIPQKPGIVSCMQTVYTRLSLFSWEGPGSEASTTPCAELCSCTYSLLWRTYVHACMHHWLYIHV